MSQFFSPSGLKNRSDEVRLKAARDLQKFVSTELRELPDDRCAPILEEVSQNIFALVSSAEVHEKKGGILAIVSLTGCSNLTRLSRFAIYLRNIVPHSDVTLTEMTAKAIGQLALWEGTYPAVQFELKRATEWLGGVEQKKLAALLILRELANHTPTLFYQQIQSFFEEIFAAIRDPKPLIRESAVSVLRACLRLAAQRETKEGENDKLYERSYREAIGGMQEGAQAKDRDDRVHGSLLIINELIVNSAWPDESIRAEVTEGDEPVDSSGLESLMEVDPVQHHPQLPATSVSQKLGTPMVRRFPGFVHGLSAGKQVEQRSHPSKACQHFLNKNFDELCRLCIKNRNKNNSQIQQTLLTLLPRIAALNQELFALNYLSDGVGYILATLKKEREKPAAFKALSLMVYVLKDRMELDPVLSIVKINLPSSKEPFRRLRHEPAVFLCISMLARAVGPQVEAEMKALLEPMFATGLSPELTSALKILHKEVPQLRRDIMERLLHMLHGILLHQQMRHPGAPKSPVATTPAPPLNMAFHESDNAMVTLALQTLSSFSFGAHIPQLQLVQSCADMYLNSEHKSICMEAIKTCAALLVPSLLPINIYNSPFASFSSASAVVVGDVIKKMLMVGVTSPDDEIRECVLTSLDERFDAHLAQADNLTTLFVAMHDGVFHIRELAICSIGRLSNMNPAFVMPTLRKVLIQILTELEFSGIGRNKEQSARLLGHLVANSPKLVKPYQGSILKVLVPKLKETDANPSVVVNIMATIGELAQVAGSDMKDCVDELCPFIMEMLQDSSSLSKREVALWTFGQLVENTGYVIAPYHQFSNLLDVLFNLLKTEQTRGIRREVIRVLGLLGALDPYKKQLQEARTRRSKMGTPHSKPLNSKTEDAQGHTAGGDMANELLITMGAGSDLEEFYPAIAINSLMRILKDQSLQQHHVMAVQALIFVFKSLGIKSVTYLPQVMPPFLSVIRSCDMREFMFKQLEQIVSIVKQHARDYMPDIFTVIREFWSPSGSIQNTIILLIEKIFIAMGDEIKVYLPRMVQPVLQLFMQDTSEQKLSTQKMLGALQLCGASLDEYLHLLISPIVKVFEIHTNPLEVRKVALETLNRLSSTLDFSDFASQIIHGIANVVDQCPDLRTDAMETLCCLVLQLGQRYKIFIPMLKKVFVKHHYQYPKYDMYMCRLLKDEPLTPDDDVDQQSKSKKPPPPTQDFDNLEAASFKKYTVDVNCLAKVWSTQGRISKDDWMEWLRRLSVELLKESPSPSLRSCWALAQAYSPLARELFNAAFVSCWMDLRPMHQEELLSHLKTVLKFQNIPEIAQTILNLAEFMEHCEEAVGRLPLGNELLGDCAIKCHAYAKALHYKEEEFHQDPSSRTLESLIAINNKLQQADAASGVVVYAQNCHSMNFKVQEEWYESLRDWDAAYKAYQNKQYLRPDDMNLTLGRMRCLSAMCKWSDLYQLAEDSWGAVDDETRQKMSVMASAAAWGLGEWDRMKEYAGSIPKGTMDCSFYHALLNIHDKKFDKAQECISDARDILDTELTALVGESYNRAYSVMVSTQLLSELEEIIQCVAIPEKKQVLQQSWWDRLLGCQHNVEDWQRILQVRSMVLTQQEEIKSWVKFASICRKSGKMDLSRKTLMSLLKSDQSFSEQLHPISLQYPQVTLAYMKHLWQAGQRQEAFDHLSRFITSQKPLAVEDPAHAKLLARCYLKLGDWRNHLDEKNQTHSTISSILQYYELATTKDRGWYKAWHAWAFMNFQALLLFEQGAGTSQRKNRSHDSADGSAHPDPSVVSYACSAVKGFYKSIALSVESSLQDTLRLLTVWFDYGYLSEVYETLAGGLKTVDIDTWLQVIPQLIARIDSSCRLVRKLIHDLLTAVGKQHPQALIYPLTVASKSQSTTRKEAAETILQNMCEHSSALVQQAVMVSEELIRVAILWHEQWHEGLEDASRLYFGEHNIPGMLKVLEPLHIRMDKGPETLKESSFNHTYGRDLLEAFEWCKKYQSTSNARDLTQAWELYYNVFRRISKQLPQLTTLELQYVSPKLLACKDLELAVPGTYEPNQDIVKIRSVSHTLNVITSKQRPRKLVIHGSNGSDYMFLLKGHEDLRQDERVMQLFGLVNTLLSNDPETLKRHLSIQRYSVIPLSPNSGLIGWVPHCDTIHSLIRDYREKKKIMLNIEHRLMLQTSPDYDHLMLLQKVEVFEHAIESTTSGDDLARVLWLKSPSSEVWFDRRTNYTRSLAVMSMVGYILGLGDRHPSNLMLDRLTGRILHIDFGDCFEVAMTREKFPEKIPFRLTRMLVNAMEVTGIEGNFRRTCNSVMSVLRENKDSVMAVLEAFVYDPLLNWRLIDEHAKPKGRGEVRKTGPAAEPVPPSSPSRPGGHTEDREPEEVSKKALQITRRVREKLTGNDFPREKPNLDVDRQVQLLIEQATSHENLCQCYIGWCPFW